MIVVKTVAKPVILPAKLKSIPYETKLKRSVYF